jgi:hypothetical protein
MFNCAMVNEMMHAAKHYGYTGVTEVLVTSSASGGIASASDGGGGSASGSSGTCS